VEDLGDTPKRLGYADPPYPGLAHRYYRDHPDYAGEVDHAELIASLSAAYDGWALSTSREALRDLLPLCPPNHGLGVWLKANGPDPRTRGVDHQWEPVIYVPARERKGAMVRDWLYAKPARGGGDLMGRKPIAFCMWLFQLLGAAPVDDLDDLFPGTGVVQSSWRQFQAAASERCRGDASPPAPRDGSEEYSGDGRRPPLEVTSPGSP